MFQTANRVLLSQIATPHGTVHRDGPIYTVGKIPTRAPAKLVMVQSARYLPDVIAQVDAIAGVICPADLADLIPEQMACLISADPKQSAFYIHRNLCDKSGWFWPDHETIVHPSAVIHPRAVIAERGVTIGANTVIQANATINERTIIGQNCLIAAGAVIGGEAFETAEVGGVNRLQAHAGGVRIGDNVTILANSHIARCIYPVMTEIGDGCAIDALTYIAHDCVMGANCKVAAGVAINGRVTIGAASYVGPNSVISNGLTLGEGSFVTLGSTVTRDVPAGQKVTGNFAISHDRFLQNLKASSG